MESAHELRSAVDEALAKAPRELVLDLSALESVDASGLATIIDTSRQAQSDGVDFGLIRGDGTLRQALHATQLDSRLRMLD